jgi:hypothetical protein
MEEAVSRLRLGLVRLVIEASMAVLMMVGVVEMKKMMMEGAGLGVVFAIHYSQHHHHHLVDVLVVQPS